MAYELDNPIPVLLAPEALKSLQQLPDDDTEISVGSTSIVLVPDRLQNMADALETPVYLDELAIVLAAGRHLPNISGKDESFQKAAPATPYTPAQNIGLTTDLPDALSKSELQKKDVLEVRVNRWTDLHLAKQTAYSLQEDTLRLRRRAQFIRIVGGELGGMAAAGGLIVVNHEAWWQATTASLAVGCGIAALTEIVVGNYKNSKAYNKQTVVATYHHPLKIVRE